MVMWSVIVIVALIAGLAFYLFVVGGQLKKIATNLEECAGLVRTIRGHAKAIEPGLKHVNRTGGVVAGAGAEAHDDRLAGAFDAVDQEGHQLAHRDAEVLGVVDVEVGVGGDASGDR